MSTHSAPQQSLTDRQKVLMDESMTIMDAHFAFPLLWRSAKLSSWYTVGLLARGSEEDVTFAEKILANVSAVQYAENGEENYGTFPNDFTVAPASNAGLIPPEIYETFDPNNALFVTLAGIIIDAKFGDRISKESRKNLQEVMRIAVESDSRREGGVLNDNLYPAYSNAWYMRCVCSAYIGAMTGDETVVARAEKWAQEAVDRFDQFGTMSEFNSGTYTGVTIFALSLAQFLPPSTVLFQQAPRILTALWDQTAETYNPSLRTLSGPWDRTYGFDMTEYCGVLGSTLAAFLGRDPKTSPLPKALDGCSHYSDLAMIPMQMIVGRFAEQHITPATRAKFENLYADHLFTAQAMSPPFDKSPRRYTCWVENGLSAGGIEFDQKFVGGASINTEQFTPGVILWDAGGDSAGAGWISYYPSNSSCSIVAGPGNLIIRYLPSRDFPSNPRSTIIQLDISSFPFHQLSKDAFRSGKESLPGLDIQLSGNAITDGTRLITYGLGRQGLRHYSLSYTVPEDFFTRNEELELKIRWTKTIPPKSRLVYA